MESSSSPLALIQTGYQAFAAGNLTPFFNTLADGAVINSHSHPSSPFHGVHEGHDAIAAYFGNLPKVELERFDVHTMVESNNRVIVLVDVRRITKASGVVTEGQFVHVWRFAEGKIVQGDIYEASASLD